MVVCAVSSLQSSVPEPDSCRSQSSELRARTDSCSLLMATNRAIKALELISASAAANQSETLLSVECGETQCWLFLLTHTYIGNVLVSINPYKKLAIYSNSLAREYRTRGPFQLPPHIFAVAGSAYRWLRDCNQDQCVVVSGESGSGKTEAARMVLHFITVTSSADDVIRERLLQSAPLLEAFGNAKTYRNDNSSRFVSSILFF
ncbi:microtubule motor activity protein [Homalodisca vitripennis]|nr:microtubule motor activity protein [Homalodisca vitripennis]